MLVCQAHPLNINPSETVALDLSPDNSCSGNDIKHFYGGLKVMCVMFSISKLYTIMCMIFQYYIKSFTILTIYNKLFVFR